MDFNSNRSSTCNDQDDCEDNYRDSLMDIILYTEIDTFYNFVTSCDCVDDLEKHVKSGVHYSDHHGYVH